MVVAALCVAALVLPVSAGSVEWFDSALWVLGPVAAALVALSFRLDSDPLAAGVSGLVGLAAAVWVALELIHQPGVAGQAALGYWVYVVGLGLLAWYVMAYLSASQSAQPWLKRALFLLVPGLFGLWLLVLWEVIVVGFGVPRVLLPAPSAVAEVFAASTPTLAADFVQTFVRAVIPGFLIGNGAGFVTALLADRVPFLRRGLLPLGNLVSAIPIVGIAPIMVMWFGFDWQSKAAVVVIMTFFPMLVNTITGLAESGAMERDLMHSYAAGYRRELLNLRLPNALPFVFNALKINSTLALIGAIVAEFFGTPIVGMGFRISTEVGRMNIDMVWATIAVAALSGSLFYGLFAVLERYLTFWHPSFRGRLR
jgi:NitT/TauT family transport system permease protein